MTERPPARDAAPPGTTGRAGRNLPVAIAVGVGLGAAVLITLFTIKAIFLGLVVVAICLAIGELCRGLRAAGARPPVVPLAAGAIAILLLAYHRGAQGMVVGALLTAGGLLVWRLAEGADDYLTDVAAGLLALVWVAFLAGFCVLMLVPADGPRRVTAFIATVVCSDVGGYAVGVFAGRHLLAPQVSPKKSWEGLVGSALACALAGGIFFPTLFSAPIWQGVCFGLALTAAAIVGDLGESMIKRDLGLKDLGNLLPGHGGFMERLDSLLPAAPVAWLLLSTFLPAH